MPKIRFHDLRHYHANWLYSQGIPDQYAAKRLGHDIQTLKTIYQHLGVDKKEEIDNNIRQLYSEICIMPILTNIEGIKNNRYHMKGIYLIPPSILTNSACSLLRNHVTF